MLPLSVLHDLRPLWRLDRAGHRSDHKSYDDCHNLPKLHPIILLTVQGQRTSPFGPERQLPRIDSRGTTDRFWRITTGNIERSIRRIGSLSGQSDIALHRRSVLGFAQQNGSGRADFPSSPLPSIVANSEPVMSSRPYAQRE